MLGIDTNFLVNASILFMNSLIQIFGDYYLYYLAKDIAGKEGAIMSLSYTIFNRRMNEIFSKTMTNGAEASLCLAALYYYNNIKPKFDKNMVLMTICISLAFIVRSSSLIGFIPLALSKIFQSFDFFYAILISGIFVAIPTMALSILIDTMNYGKFTIPQVNFVHVNVVENISKYFGVENWFYYLHEIRGFIFANSCCSQCV